jgi:hypothetical protein
MTSDLTLPPVAAPYLLPFHYGALHNVGLDYLVDPGPVRKTLAEHHPDLTAADFGGRACVTLNYQLYFAQYPNGGGVTQEIEYSIVAHPTASADRLARLSYEEYARGHDQTKLLGIARLHVLCDNPLAIEAGTKLYGEPKYPASFEVTMPSLNGPGGESWHIACHQAANTPSGDGADRRAASPLFSFDADLTELPHVPVNNTPITGYGTDPDGRPRRSHERLPALPVPPAGDADRRPRTAHRPRRVLTGRRRPAHPHRRRPSGRRVDLPIAPGRRPQPPVLRTAHELISHQYCTDQRYVTGRHFKRCRRLRSSVDRAYRSDHAVFSRGLPRRAAPGRRGVPEPRSSRSPAGARPFPGPGRLASIIGQPIS